MKRLWDVECYKIRKSVYLKLACLGAVIYGFMELWADASANRLCGFTVLMQSFINWEIPYLMCGIFAAFYISGDLENGGIYEEITGGFCRGKIYIVKTGLFFGASMIVTLCYEWIPTIVFSCLNGFSNEEGKVLWKGIFCMEGIYLILMVACVSSCVLFSFVFCKAAGSVVAEVVYILVLIPIMLNMTGTSEIAAKIYRIFPYYKFQILMENIMENCNMDAGLILPPETAGMLGHINGAAGIMIGSGTAFLLPVLAGYFIFRHSRFI